MTVEGALTPPENFPCSFEFHQCERSLNLLDAGILNGMVRRAMSAALVKLSTLAFSKEPDSAACEYYYV